MGLTAGMLLDPLLPRHAADDVAHIAGSGGGVHVQAAEDLLVNGTPNGRGLLLAVLLLEFERAAAAVVATALEGKVRVYESHPVIGHRAVLSDKYETTTRDVTIKRHALRDSC